MFSQIDGLLATTLVFLIPPCNSLQFPTQDCNSNIGIFVTEDKHIRAKVNTRARYYHTSITGDVLYYCFDGLPSFIAPAFLNPAFSAPPLATVFYTYCPFYWLTPGDESTRQVIGVHLSTSSALLQCRKPFFSTAELLRPRQALPAGYCSWA